MAQKDTSLDDIADAITALATNIDHRFEQVDARFGQIDQRFEQVDSRFSSIESDIREIRREQVETRKWLERIDNRLGGVESDITEIYDQIVRLEKRAPNLTQSEAAELQRRLAAMIEWAQAVSKKTGVPLPRL